MLIRTKNLSAFLLIFVSFFSAKATITAPKWVLYSPDKSVCINIFENTSGSNFSLSYNVISYKSHAAETVIETSPFGIVRTDNAFTNNLSFVSASRTKTVTDNYKLHTGRQTKIKSKARELSLTYKNNKNALLQINFRAYNDGIAFNYVFPEHSGNTYTVTDELTGFKIPTTARKWLQPYDAPTKWTPAYEEYFENGITVGTASKNIEGWAYPAHFKTKNHWLLISEANLTDNYCGTRLEQNAPEGLYKIRFPDPLDGQGVGEVNPSYTLPWAMPWRTIIVGSSIGQIFESQMINNLSNKELKMDFSWVKPGRSSWSWLLDANSPQNFESLKKFVDLSAQMKWEYTLVDANWDLMKGGTIRQLVDYSNSKGVGVFMWYNSGGAHNTVEERPRNIIDNAELRKAEFKKLQEWGVKGVKIDFWQSDKQNIIKLYHEVLKDAAHYQLLVNLHGCTLPRGWSRIYPNLIALEAVRGEECYTFDNRYAALAPSQNTIIPFTRNVVGPTDYTPVVFSNAKFPHITTYAHELALSLIFNAGVVHFADNTESYNSKPDYVQDFLKTVPVVFDESHYIMGEPGKDVVIASRKGKLWYVAGINGEKNSKDLSFKLPFLKGNNYNLNIIMDGKDMYSFENSISTLKKNDAIKIKMLENGGFVAVLTQK